MPIQNIDNYLMPNRSQEVSIHRTAEENRIPAEQRFLTHEVNAQADRKLTRTNEADNAALRDYGFDPREKGNNEDYVDKDKKKRKKKTEDDDEYFSEVMDKMLETSGRTIDIKL